MRRIPVFAPTTKQWLCNVSPREAKAMLADRSAVRLIERDEDGALVERGLRLLPANNSVRSAPAITAREAHAAAAGCPRARKKINAWAFVGQPALRHAQ